MHRSVALLVEHTVKHPFESLVHYFIDLRVQLTALERLPVGTCISFLRRDTQEHENEHTHLKINHWPISS